MDQSDTLTYEELIEVLKAKRVRGLAARLGVSRSTVSRVITGARKPGKVFLQKLGLRPVVVYEVERPAEEGHAAL